jgi:hypothetical protein
MISPLNFGEKDPIAEFAKATCAKPVTKITGVWLKKSMLKCVTLLL